MSVSDLLREKYPDAVLLTTAQIAEVTGVPAPTIRRAVRDRRLPAFKAGKIILIEPSAVDEWITSAVGDTV